MFSGPLAEYSDRLSLEALGVPADAYYIRELGTDSRFRKQGMCTRAIDELCLHASAAHRTVSVRTREDNVALTSILDKKSFTFIGGCSAETGGAASNRVVYTKALS